MSDINPVLFYVLSAVIIISALVVIRARNIFHAALSLGLTFFGVAGIFLTLKAEFIAGAQILIYVGAIIVLILFAIMLIHNIQNRETESFNRLQIISFVSVSLLAIFFGLIIVHQNWPIISNPALTTETNVREIGKMLMQEYILPFELISVLLLGALIGSIVIARKEKTDDRS